MKLKGENVCHLYDIFRVRKEQERFFISSQLILIKKHVSWGSFGEIKMVSGFPVFVYNTQKWIYTKFESKTRPLSWENRKFRGIEEVKHSFKGISQREVFSWISNQLIISKNMALQFFDT